MSNDMNPVVVTASTHGMDGKPVKMCRVIKRYPSLRGAVYLALAKRKDKGEPFKGETVTVRQTSGEERVFLFEPDTGNMVAWNQGGCDEQS